MYNTNIENSELDITQKEHILLLKESFITKENDGISLLPLLISTKPVLNLHEDDVASKLESHASININEDITFGINLQTRDNDGHDLPTTGLGSPNSEYGCLVCATAVSVNDFESHVTSKEHQMQSASSNLTTNNILEERSNLEIWCKVCCIHIGYNDVADKEKSCQEKQIHLSSTHHEQCYEKLLQDNYIHIFNLFASRCELCSTVFYNADELKHINEETHKQLMQRLNVGLVSSDKDQKATNEDGSRADLKQNQVKTSYYNTVNIKRNTNIQLIDGSKKNSKIYGCIICEMAITVKEFKIHVTSNKHKINVKIHNLSIHHMIKEKNQELWCKICVIKIGYTYTIKHATSRVQQNIHLISTVYNQCHIKFLRDNDIIQLEDCILHCQLCSSSFYEMDELIHVKENTHVKKMTQKRTFRSVTDITYVTDENTKALSRSTTEANFKLRNNIKSNKRMIGISNAGSNPKCMQSSVCNAPGTSKAYTLSQKADVNVLKPSKSQDLKLARTFYLIKQANSPGTFLCIVCNKRIPNKEDSITTHFNGKRHINKYETLLKENSIIKLDDGFKCNLCLVELKIGAEVAHIKEKNHVDNLKL